MTVHNLVSKQYHNISINPPNAIVQQFDVKNKNLLTAVLELQFQLHVFLS